METFYVQKPYKKDRRTRMYIMGVLFLIMVGIAAYVSHQGSSRMSYRFEEGIFTVSYPEQEDIEIPVEEITSMELLEGYEEGECLSGISEGNVRFGLFAGSEGRQAYVAMNKRIASVIYLSTPETDFVLNFENKASTQSLYEAIGKLIDKEE